MTDFPGTAGNDILTGTSGDDNFDITLGGNDTVTGAGGKDFIKAGAALTALDIINGGTGYDTIELKGDYSAGLVFNTATLRNVEEIRFGAGFNYNVTTHDYTVAAGTQMKVDAYFNGLGHSVTFDGSAETNGSFLYYDGTGSDTVKGGAMGDSFVMGYGGTDKVYGNDGGDVIYGGGAFNSTDVFDGGAGSDVLYLFGDYGPFSITGSMMKSIESLYLGETHNYGITISDDVIGAGENLYVNGGGITGGGYLSFNGSAETDGTLSFMDSSGNDNLIGGANNDVFLVNHGGSDILQGGGGNDSFNLYDTLDASDTVLGGLGNDDSLNITGDYSAGIVFDMFTMNGIETLSVGDGFNYKITLDDANVGPGKSLTVRAGYLSAAYSLTFDGSAETDGSFQFLDGSGNDSFTGGAGKDYLDAGKGGDDKFFGGAGDDSVNFWGKWTTADYVDGGDGKDHVYFSGDYGPSLTLGANQFKNVEAITVGGFAYNITALNSLVGAGQTMAVDSYYAKPGENLYWNAANESDGSYSFTGGDGDDTFIGGSKNDTFFLNREGIDTMSGNVGNDTFSISSGITAADTLNGGAGYDTVNFGATLASPLVLSATTMTNMEEIDFFYGKSYAIVTNDATVGAGKTLAVDARFLTATDVLRFDGSAETDGSFAMKGGSGADLLTGGSKNDSFIGGNGADTLKGNAGADTLEGGMGKDQLWGGLGNDTFVFKSAADAGDAVTCDLIRDWNAGDKIDLSGIDAVTTMGSVGDQAFTFIGTDAFHPNTPGELRFFSNATTTYLRGDTNGDGIYDFQIGISGIHTITTADLIL